MQIISRKEAKTQGLERYFTGKPCKNGDLVERRTSDGHCLGDACEGRRERRRKAYYQENRDWLLLEKRKRYNPDAAKEQNRKSYLENAEARREYRRRYYHSNKESCKEATNKFHENNPEWRTEYNRKYYKKNRDRSKEATRLWYRENRADAIEASVKRKRKLRRNSPEYRMTDTMRGMVRRTLERKTDLASSVLGYTAVDLCAHIERQFLPGMTWENYGFDGWHVDHIYPIAQFIRDGETDPAVINCLSNLRPVWAKDNLSKGDKIELLI